jgi:hypothetical protein
MPADNVTVGFKWSTVLVAQLAGYACECVDVFNTVATSRYLFLLNCGAINLAAQAHLHWTKQFELEWNLRRF